MPFESLGILETGSVSASIKAVNALIKVNEVTIIGKQILGDGIVSVFIKGNLGAIRTALNLGAEALKDSGQFRHSHIIPLPHKDLLLKFNLERKEL